MYNSDCVNSRTGYVITVANSAIICQSKMKPETALLTIKAESFAFSNAIVNVSHNGWSQHYGQNHRY